MNDSPSARLSDLHPGFQFLQYQLLEQIGSGGQGLVWSALDTSHNRIVAIKFNEVDDPEHKQESETHFARQANQLIRLTHPNILPLYDFGLIPPIRYLVMPYVSGGSLQDRLISGPLPVKEILDYSSRIASALGYLHAQGIIHRDLKPSNILMDFGDRLYVADFGLARIVADTTQAMHTGHGTPPYAPPEQHTMGELSTKSDIFGFGVMLYQLFTRQLPWNGEKSLGMQQVFSKEELPDPREINPDLPSELLKVLRVITAANPAARPETATEAVKLLYSAFGAPMPVQPTVSPVPVKSNLDAQALLAQSMRGWDPDGGGTIRLSLTRFAVLELEQKQAAVESKAKPEVPVFMLQNALTYGYNDDFWWPKVTNLKERLDVASQLLSKDNKVINERVVRHIVQDEQVKALKAGLPGRIALAFLEVAYMTDDPALKAQIFNSLRVLTPASKEWRRTALGTSPDIALATLALEPPPVGDSAASLIGHLHSQLAVETIVKEAREMQKKSALMAIRESAGSLPKTVPQSLKLEVNSEWLLRRLIDQPMTLLQVYAFIALGVALSAGLRAYLAYRLPVFLDTLRITGSLEHGIFLGILFGFGVFAARLVMERFPESNALLRIGLATLLGGVLLSIALFIYDVLFNDNVPQGLLFIAGCLLISAAYAFGSWIQNRPARMALTAIGVVTALSGSWWGHLFFARAGMTMTPIFFYDYQWSGLRVLLLIFVVALPMAILGNLGDLHPNKSKVRT